MHCPFFVFFDKTLLFFGPGTKNIKIKNTSIKNNFLGPRKDFAYRFSNSAKLFNGGIFILIWSLNSWLCWGNIGLWFFSMSSKNFLKAFASVFYSKTSGISEIGTNGLLFGLLFGDTLGNNLIFIFFYIGLIRSSAKL